MNITNLLSHILPFYLSINQKFYLIKIQMHLNLIQVSFPLFGQLLMLILLC